VLSAWYDVRPHLDAEPRKCSVEIDAVNKRLGSVVGTYLVLRVIGRGGMATVYAARAESGAEVALKVLHRPLTTDDVAVARFFEEAYLVNSVKHPGVCRIIDDGVSEDGCPFLVMELLEGETLEACLAARTTLTVGDTLDIGVDVADTLTVVHRAGIVHRDLKPANLFLTRQGTVKVLDFGVGKGRALAAKTLDGALLGTPAFMSPEQATGSGTDDVDGRADVFCLAAVLFRCLSGTNVHEGDNTYAQWFAAAKNRARSLRDVAPELPAEIVTTIDAGLAFERDQRPTASEFHASLVSTRKFLRGDAGSTGEGSFVAMIHELSDLQKR
jgi:serine/threonine protein kinase